MERLFSPCTRLHDMLESQGLRDIELLRELNLDVSTEELLSAERAFTYADLYALLGNLDTVAWLTPHAAVVLQGGRGGLCWGQLNNSCRFCISTDDGNHIYALARSREHLLEICDIVLRLLAASVVYSVHLNDHDDFLFRSDGRAMINAPALAYLIEQCQSLKSLSLHELEMDEDHCCVLGALSRPGLEIELVRCKFTSAGANALAEVLGRNRGPTKLHHCEIDNVVLADGLRRNSRLKSVILWIISSSLEVGDREVVAIAGALRENKGLVELELRCSHSNMKYETWVTVCDSLKTHPTLEVLDLVHGVQTMAPDVITSGTQALVDMIKVNTSIQTLRVHPCYMEHEMYRGSVMPYIETNRFRPRLLAIQKARPIVYRAKVLGRALLATRTNANKFWMLLSGNAEVAFMSRTMRIAASANVTAIAASVMSALTITATGSLPAATCASFPSTASASVASASTPTVAAAAANVATPSTGQKRKARP
jgi:hypothetical protein